MKNADRADIVLFTMKKRKDIDGIRDMNLNLLNLFDLLKYYI